MVKFCLLVLSISSMLFGTVFTTAYAQTVSDAPTVSPTTATSQATCNSLTADKQTTGVAPLALNFTANGSASGSAISKATFTFGDGQTYDATDSASFGGATANVSAAHTYTTPGTYQATAVFADSNDVPSPVTSTCTQTITVTSAAVTPTVTIAPTKAPTTPVTGSSAITLGLSLAALLLAVGGGFLFFVL